MSRNTYATERVEQVLDAITRDGRDPVTGRFN